MDNPLLDRTGEIIGSKQEPDNQRAAMGELRRWAQDHNMQGLTDQQIRDAFVSAYLYRWLSGAPLEDCVHAGLIGGAVACTAAGTHTAFAGPQDLE